ncbi:MAG: four helix bundle protein [Candidatus Firestonebacteria bacterium RIFOXYC2_FULL_39_67]|nr:MAG: four helix bundle protein [Candidatus Firestonebacteria bacterium RIFOXYD2_FULL_39_29]OGF53258.1 MAG: four helix bundle protein [Candidatus Firestonebacteria bacterium RifOxyC12_full_39_7]OGF55792.1 MAG: four helix bundle protein [Candidatus Firestonebacteria bacterium RIFOXYC2_FULL_39_67]
MPFLFENLKVYQNSLNFAEEVSNLTEGFRKGTYYLVDQLNRASLSIATNIAEGNGRFQKADRIHFFRIARGSAFECVPILELCKRKQLISEEPNKKLKEKLNEIGKMLTGLIQY